MTTSNLESLRARATTKEQRDLIDALLELKRVVSQLEQAATRRVRARPTVTRRAANLALRCMVEPHEVIVDGLEAIADAIFEH